jgi:hypothetical protein
MGTGLKTDFGETWTYESIVGALPGIRLSPTEAIVLQVGLFEAALLVLAFAYDAWNAVAAGTVAVAVAGVGSVAMLRMGRGVRELDVPDAYLRLLFGSSIEVVLSVLAFIALITHLFVFDPVEATTPLLVRLFGDSLPVPVVYLMLLVLWDLCYRIGTSWWAAVVALWRGVTYSFDPDTASSLARMDATNVAFAGAQALILPFLLDQPVLLAAVGGHIVAVTVVSAAAILATRRATRRRPRV